MTFEASDAARRASMVLGNSSTKMLAYQSVNVTTHPAPPAPSRAPKKKTQWEEHEMVEQAQQIIIKELTGLLEKDITDRVVGPDLRALIAKEKVKGSLDLSTEIRPVEKRGLKGLSFKKQRKQVVEEVKVAEVEVVADEVEAEQGPDVEEEDESEVVVEPPKKKRKKEVAKKVSRKVVEEDVESEDEDPVDLARAAEMIRKRAASEDLEDEESEPVRKKPKLEVSVEIVTKAKKTSKKKKSTKKGVEEPVDDVVLPEDMDFHVPAVAHVHITSGFDSSLSPSPAPEPPRVVTPPPTPPPDALNSGLCEDDEDLYYLKLVLSGYKPPVPEAEPEAPPPPPSPDAPAFRKHVTGSARTEGYYKITHAEKAAYVAQYQARATTIETITPPDEPPPQHITSSRSNRANARRRAQGLEEINQVQRAVALSKGETAANELSFKFNQLQTRKKHLRFARSPIHDWGLYAMEKISRGEMVIEYVGEVIRAQVADKREKAYERQGIGSSYLFRIDEDLVVDATKKGNLGSVFIFISQKTSRLKTNDRRLINHSCDPNCTAKIITINGEKKIVIYAKQDIELGDEITYGAFLLTSKVLFT